MHGIRHLLLQRLQDEGGGDEYFNGQALPFPLSSRKVNTQPECRLLGGPARHRHSASAQLLTWWLRLYQTACMKGRSAW